MVTTAAFRMSTNDDLKKTANWSGMNQESPPDNTSKRNDWSGNVGTRTSNPTPTQQKNKIGIKQNSLRNSIDKQK
jgi:hypothetical protein